MDRPLFMALLGGRYSSNPAQEEEDFAPILVDLVRLRALADDDDGTSRLAESLLVLSAPCCSDLTSALAFSRRGALLWPLAFAL